MGFPKVGNEMSQGVTSGSGSDLIVTYISFNLFFFFRFRYNNQYYVYSLHGYKRYFGNIHLKKSEQLRKFYVFSKGSRQKSYSFSGPATKAFFSDFFQASKKVLFLPPPH